MLYESNMKALQNLLYTTTRLLSEMAGACAVAHSELQKYSDLPSEECVPSTIVDLIEQAEKNLPPSKKTAKKNSPVTLSWSISASPRRAISPRRPLRWKLRAR